MCLTPGAAPGRDGPGIAAPVGLWGGSGQSGLGRRGRGRAGLAHDQLGLDDRGVRERLPAEVGDQQPGRGGPDLVAGLAHGGQRRVVVVRQRDVVEADDVDVLGDAPARRAQRLDRAGGHQVVVREDRVEVGALVQQRPHGLAPGREAEVAGDDPGFRDRVPGLGVDVDESGHALHGAAEAQLPGDHRRPGASGGQQVARGGLPAQAVAGRDGRELRAGLAVVDQDDRHALGVELGDVVQLALGLDDQQRVERLGRDLVGELAHRLVAVMAGEDHEPAGLRLHDVHRALQHVADPGPGQARDQHADDPRAAPGQAHRAGAGHVAQLGDDPADALGRGRVQLALAVQDARDRGLGDSGLRCHIGDGDLHGFPAFSGAVGPVRDRSRNRLRERFRGLSQATKEGFGNHGTVTEGVNSSHEETGR